MSLTETKVLQAVDSNEQSRTAYEAMAISAEEAESKIQPTTVGLGTRLHEAYAADDAAKILANTNIKIVGKMS